MAAQKGLELTIAVGNGASPETYTSDLAGIRNVTISFNQGTAEITSADDTSRFRQLLAGAAVKSMTVTGDGVFTDSTVDATLRTQAFATDAFKNYQLTVPDFGTFTGAFTITSLEYAGAHDGEVTYSITLESAGDITFATV